MTDSTTIIFAGETARNVAVALLLSLAGFVCLCMLARNMWKDRETRREIERRRFDATMESIRDFNDGLDRLIEDLDRK